MVLASRMNLKRPKIVQQIIAVLLVAVLIPIITIGIIISNVSQQSVRRELNYSAKMIAQFVGENIATYYKLTEKKDDAKLVEILTNRFAKENRQIYVLDEKRNVVATNSKNVGEIKDVLENLPLYMPFNSAELFGKIKNQPMAYYKLKEPNWLVVVNTTEKITKNTINVARFRIILSLSLAGLFIFFVVGLYTFYLYLNIRQLFKGIIAISKGNYERKIRLIKNIFSPYEMYFLAKEFNFMAKKISQSYKDLSEKNLELERLDEFRGSLISAISHEFRTPLTSITGYSSRLLRNDIQIDEATKLKSLKIIKEQAQMLSRMVEDLLVIPEIDSFSLKFDLKKLELAKIIEKSALYANPKNHEIVFEMKDDALFVLGDENRLIQIFSNLLDNATKYSENNQPVKVVASSAGGKIFVEIINAHRKVEPQILEKLFEKFTRVDSDLTRTTRGTGLGLYIVKGLCNAMKIKINLASEDEKFIVQLECKEIL